MRARSSTHAKGIDVARYQGDIDWRQVAGDNVSFAFVKATEGVGYQDPTFIRNYEGAKENGILVGVYHFATPEIGDEKSEVDYLKRVLDRQSFRHDLPVALDLERTTLNRAQTIQWAHNWLYYAEQTFGRRPILYTYVSFANNYLDGSLAAYPLWIAHYGVARPGSVPGWDDWTFFQYTSSGSIKGIIDRVDLNEYAGTVQELKKWIGGRIVTDGKKYRLKTGTFSDARSLADAKSGLMAFKPWMVYERADSLGFDPNYRLYTGTFANKQEAERAAESVREKFGWVVYVEEV